jgi:hypothetical protein
MFKTHSLLRFLILPLALLLVGMGLASTKVAAAPSTISWSAPINLSRTGDKSVYPITAVDANGKIHVAWLEYDAEGTQTSRLFYTNNISGNFIAPFRVTSGAGKNATHMTAIAVETNRVHIFFTAGDKSMRHRLVTLNGAIPSAGAETRLTPGGAKGYAPHATVDPAGRVHAVWIDDRSGTYNVYHRIWANGGWEGGDRNMHLFVG